MKLDEFWNLIDNVNSTTKPDDQRAILAATKMALMEYSADDIVDWYHIKAQYHVLSDRDDLWEECINLGIHASDDGYYYFRAWLIAQGKDVFFSVLDNPNTLSNYVRSADDSTFELYNYIASDAYSERKIKDLYSETELQKMCEQWCVENEDRVERYSYHSNIDMGTGGKKLFQSYISGKYNLYDRAEEKPLSDDLKQQIRESLVKKVPSLSNIIQGAETSNLEKKNARREFEPER